MIVSNAVATIALAAALGIEVKSESKSVPSLKDLLNTIPGQGTLGWIGLRPARRQPVQSVEEVYADAESGLTGDRFAGGATALRQVTLIQAEHISVVAALLSKGSIDPSLLRRNLVVAGINLQALKQKRFQIGDAIFFGTGNCAPCSRMEEALGTGGYNAMRGHGGITAYVVESGMIRFGDSVRLDPKEEVRKA